MRLVRMKVLVLLVAIGIGANEAIDAASGRAPDLAITFVSPPLIHYKGQTTPIHTMLVVENRGNQVADKSSAVLLLSRDRVMDPDEDFLLAEISVAALDENERTGFREQYEWPDDVSNGDYHVGACLDVRDKIDESNEKNNCISKGAANAVGRE